ncbi:MAG: MFS transporter [Bacteroidales bacterium]|nr:MFS transporter [Bacteroidales bacterium]
MMKGLTGVYTYSGNKSLIHHQIICPKNTHPDFLSTEDKKDVHSSYKTQNMPASFQKDLQYYKFCAYGFLKNLDFFDPFLLLFFMSKGFSFLEIGTLYAIREITINIFEIPTGMLADVMGRRRTLASSFVFYIISFILFFFSGTYLAFIIAILFYACGEAFRTGVHKAMIFEYLKTKGWQDQKVHYYGHTRSWSQKGSAISSLIAAGIVFWTGDLRMIFIFAIIPYFIDFLLILSYPSFLDGQKKYHSLKDVGGIFAETFRDFIISFKNPLILRAILTQAVYTGYYKAVKDYLQPVLKTLALALPIFLVWKDDQRTAVIIGVVYFLVYLITSYMAKISGRVADMFSNLSRPLNISMVIGLSMGLLSGVFYHYGFLFASVICYVIIYFVENLRKPMGISAVADNLDKDILATALSAESQAETLFAAMIAPLIGFCADLFGIGLGLSIATMAVLILLPLYLAKNKASLIS